MSGYLTCMSPCIGCGRLFSYNPHHVPSSDLLTGEREPICQDCFDYINARRLERGMDPFTLHPQAYQPLPEEML
jgi:hypothetical protein